MLIVFLLQWFIAPVVLSAQDKPQPNIIFFLVDDMGWQDTSVPFWTEETPFNHLYHTPAMERLAASGMKFYPGLCQQRMFAYPCEFDDGNECCKTPGNQLDFAKKCI